MSVTAEDVARVAGVSVSTVSRALSAPDKVAERTRDRILRVADEMKYRPNRSAHALATGRTSSIGLVVPDLENPYFSVLTKAIQAAAQLQGQQVFIIDTDEDPSRELHVLETSVGGADGMILCSPRAVDQELLDSAKGRKIITINRPIPGVPGVVVDYATGVEQVVRHLAALGHTDIAYVGGPSASWADQERRKGLVSGSESANTTIHDLGSFQPFFSGGVAAADLLMATPATAAIVFSDLMALGLLDRVKTRGVRVPEDLSIVSFDNSMLASVVTPHLTSVAFSNRNVARLALDLLNEESDHAGGATDAPLRTCPTELAVRASIAPAPHMVSAQ